MYNTSDMAYSKHHYQVSYFAKNSWIETPAQMLQPLIVDTLRKTHYFHAVSSSVALGNYDYILNTQILRFEQDFTWSPSIFRISLRAQLLNSASNRIVASRDIVINEPAMQDTPYGGVVAANHATARALAEMAKFTVSRVR